MVQSVRFVFNAVTFAGWSERHRCIYVCKLVDRAGYTQASFVLEVCVWALYQNMVSVVGSWGCVVRVSN